MTVVETLPLGSQGLRVSQQGLGCMGMTAFYGNFNRAEQESRSLDTIAKALDLGLNFFDTAWIYQSFGVDGEPNTTNEELLGKAIKIHGREKFVIATKFGIAMTPKGSMGPMGTPEVIRSQLADSLQRLDVEYIDLYYQHRMDPNTPIETTMDCLKELINEGKIGYLGLSECTPDEMRRAHAVHPITAIQMEYSLQSRDIEDQIIDTARELGIGIVAYSPLGRGFLSDTFSSIEDFTPGDSRLKRPRWSEENFAKNVQSKFFEYAAKKKCTPAQLALAWLHTKGDDIFPIPGTKSASRIEENFGALKVVLTKEEADEVADIVSSHGERYEAAAMASTYNSRMNIITKDL
eukprot:CAMPEP_0119038350 /NCGR_PEP_ID=MMETSP1177-20130426/7239_1 /TAXON_ID=2985 /ORGANISM="Ochromonas sp, Strain CCMP1899" /LENGTH=348 /DNA_ID=CAMNT_0007000845 /DNA_START=139 /DNA_END=1185 /DNA_ORIENTATION=-